MLYTFDTNYITELMKFIRLILLVIKISVIFCQQTKPQNPSQPTFNDSLALLRGSDNKLKSTKAQNKINEPSNMEKQNTESSNNSQKSNEEIPKSTPEKENPNQAKNELKAEQTTYTNRLKTNLKLSKDDQEAKIEAKQDVQEESTILANCFTKIDGYIYNLNEIGPLESNVNQSKIKINLCKSEVTSCGEKGIIVDEKNCIVYSGKSSIDKSWELSGMMP